MKLLLGVATVAVVGVAFFSVHHMAQSHSSSDVVKAEAPNYSLTDMNNAIQTVINNNSMVDISVSCIDLQSGASYHYGLSDPFVAASTEKVLTAAEFLKAVEQGNESLNEDIGGETAEQALQAMIVQSDDTAWGLITNERGTGALADYVAQIGITDFNVADNTLTSNDMATALEKLYKGQLLDKQYTNLLLGWMKQANYRQYIVADVPTDVTVYHKVGYLDDRIHDAAIITSPKRSYILVVFTNGHFNNDPTPRTDIFKSITQATTQYFLGET